MSTTKIFAHIDVKALQSLSALLPLVVHLGMQSTLQLTKRLGIPPLPLGSPGDPPLPPEDPPPQLPSLTLVNFEGRTNRSHTWAPRALFVGPSCWTDDLFLFVGFESVLGRFWLYLGGFGYCLFPNDLKILIPNT